MLVQLAAAERLALLRAMVVVANGAGRHELSETDIAAIRSVSRIIFSAPDDIDPCALAAITPVELASVLGDDAGAAAAGRLLAVMALFDGVLEADRLAAALRFGAALGLREQYLIDLTEAARGHLAWVGADLTRQNVVSITRGRSTHAGDLPLRPYGNGGDAALTQRYRELARHAPGTLGREFLEWYVAHHYPTPGEPQSLNEIFVRPHDSTHLLSGYSTSPQGELLVSTFTSGMMGVDEPLGAHILPAMLSLHVGVRINDVAGAWHCALAPQDFWRAWERGSRCRTNVFDAEWDFWGLAAVPLAELRAQYEIPPL
ncbi:MAG: hypothetical protein ABI629_20120 [bacterium]